MKEDGVRDPSGPDRRTLGVFAVDLSVHLMGLIWFRQREEAETDNPAGERRHTAGGLAPP